MTEHYLISLASIIILGIMAQWLAWRFHLPSILILLLVGFLAGPVTGFINPDELLGELLFPAVSLAVALILFEGGLSLKISELHVTGHVVRNLVTLGALITWLLSAGAAHLILDFDWPIAWLFGAILVVTGPTVIIPLLRQIRVVGPTNAIIKWEGIVNDPIGAILAVLVFEAILVTGLQQTAITVVISLLQTILIGLILGGFAAWGLIQLLKRYWIPDFLQNGVTLTVVLAIFTVSNLIQDEAGLLTVTVMGIILANQKAVNVKQIVEFKESLGVLLLSSLFIILAARLRPENLTHLGWNSVGFLLVLILFVRPVSVLFSTIKSGLSWREKLFLSWMAPRGIVAAAVTAIFSLELAEKLGYVQAEDMVPEMFLVIVGTVTVYGLSAAPLGRWLKLAEPNPQGVLIVGAHQWARDIASVLQKEGYQLLLVDSNRENINTARLAGLPTWYASILSEYIVDELELGGLGRLLALTPNDEVNSLATFHFTEFFGRAEVYQLPPKEANNHRQETVSPPLRGRLLFDPNLTYQSLTNRFTAGAVIKKTPLTEAFDYTAFRDYYEDRATPLFLIDEVGDLVVFTVGHERVPQPGESLISLVDSEEETSEETSSETELISDYMTV